MAICYSSLHPIEAALAMATTAATGSTPVSIRYAMGICRCRRTCSFARSTSEWARTVLAEMPKAAAISSTVCPIARSVRTSLCRGVSETTSPGGVSPDSLVTGLSDTSNPFRVGPRRKTSGGSLTQHTYYCHSRKQRLLASIDLAHKVERRHSDRTAGYTDLSAACAPEPEPRCPRADLTAATVNPAATISAVAPTE